jgi:putative intracellular protease/amidase
MMEQQLKDMKVAILVEDGFEQEELTRPRQALQEAGATTHIISPAGDEVKGWDHTDSGDAHSSLSNEIKHTYCQRTTTTTTNWEINQN